ncbi:unnamed protein product [Schistocephalus solidus]|uniref:Ysc84 domain-containing protein n=1 Tax=Schistocephalus solidus TaxID=70667 RepID=A0A183TS82_SCHSO|nr:unnamed protein product [Schistocephalus solidus]
MREVKLQGAVSAEVGRGWTIFFRGIASDNGGKNDRSGECDLGIGAVGIEVNSAVMYEHVTESPYAWSEGARAMGAVDAAIFAVGCCSRHWFTSLCATDS